MTSRRFCIWLMDQPTRKGIRDKSTHKHLKPVNVRLQDPTLLTNVILLLSANSTHLQNPKVDPYDLQDPTPVTLYSTLIHRRPSNG